MWDTQRVSGAERAAEIIAQDISAGTKREGLSRRERRERARTRRGAALASVVFSVLSPALGTPAEAHPHALRVPAATRGSSRAEHPAKIAGARQAALPMPSAADPKLAVSFPSPVAFVSPRLPTPPATGWILPETIRRRGAGYVAQTSKGLLAELTLDPRLQEATEETLKAYQIPYAGAVVLSVPDGRVLAMVGRSEAEPSLGPVELALAPWAPAASVFKLVSASAMVATGEVSSSSRVCYHGGLSSVLPENLVEQPARDTTCASLAYAIGKSQNAVIAKLAAQHLTPTLLTSAGHALGFGEGWGFDLPVAPSSLDVPTHDSLEFARTAAGFWHSTLSPFHGAVLAATMANKGEMPSPTLVARAWGTEGQSLPQIAHPGHRVLPAEVASQVAAMMTLTTRMGTARHTFMDKNARPLLPVSVAGKTGTLSAETDRGYVGYSWFVGFAPAENPSIAFAVALGNGARWRIKAAHVAREIVAAHVASRKHKTESVLASR